MRSRSTEHGMLAGQAALELLPLWLVVTLVEHSTELRAAAGFMAHWLLLLMAALLAGYVRRVWLLAAAPVLAALWLTLPPFAAFVASFVCVRALFLGSSPVRRSFALGAGFTVLFFAFVALSGTPRAALPFDALCALCLGQFVLGAVLTGLEQQRKAERSPAAFVSVLAPVLAMLLSAVFGVLGSQASSGLLRAGAGSFRVLGQLLTQVLHVLGVLLHFLGSLFEAARGGAPPPAADGVSDETWEPLVQFEPMTLPPGSEGSLVAVVLLLAFCVFAWVLIGLARRRRQTAAVSDAEPIHEERGTSWSWKLLLPTLPRGRRPRAAELQPAAAGLRALYAELLRWAAQHGARPRPSTTPRELLLQLSQRHPHKQAPLAQLTDYYEEARYAERRDTDAALHHARELLDDIERD